MRHDPRTLRDHRITLHLTHAEHRAITTTAELCGLDTSVVARRILLNQVRQLLLGEQLMLVYLPTGSTLPTPFHSQTVTIEALRHA